ncbi:hypothetical protein BU17DRAFT_84361 [Hysterangium stoloniferum]|nr:hypothetical protein BU17DRAFT_84361 [Hysterangium stoloniferum]
MDTPSRHDTPYIYTPSDSHFSISLDTREVSCPPICYKLVRQLLFSYRHVYVVSFFGIFKEKKKKGEHEFVIAAVSPLGSESHQSLVFLVVERVPHAASVVDIHRTLCSPNHHVEARDTISALDHRNLYTFIQKARLSFCSMSALIQQPPPVTSSLLTFCASSPLYWSTRRTTPLPGRPATGLRER